MYLARPQVAAPAHGEQPFGGPKDLLDNVAGFTDDLVGFDLACRQCVALRGCDSRVFAITASTRSSSIVRSAPGRG